METENANFDSIVNLIRVAKEKNSKEINKIKAIISRYEECLKQQNETLNKLLDEKLKIKSYKNDLINELRKLETSDDEEYESNNYDNQVKDDSCVQINSVNINTRNDSYKNTHPNSLDNRIQIGYYEPNKINMDKSVEIIHEDRCQTNLNMLANCDDGPIKINFRNDYCLKSQNTKRTLMTLQANKIIPENENSIFEDVDFIEYYSPKLMYKFINEAVVEMIAINNFLYVCCEQGILLIYHIKNKKWTKMFTESSKQIQQYMKCNDNHYLFCGNEFFIFSESKTKLKVFDSNIISNIRRFRNKHPFCYISLENGQIWRYDVTNDYYEKIFSFHSKMKACINLPTKFSLFLTEDKKVFITNENFKEIPELSGCVDIIASYGIIVVCYFGNGVCKIYNAENKRIIELEISESIKFAKHSKLFLSILDVQNRLHLYAFMRNTFNYKKIQLIKISTSKNISAMSDVIDDQIFFIVENSIYSIII